MSRKLIFTSEFELEVIKFYLEPNTLNDTVKQFKLNNRQCVKHILERHNICLHDSQNIQKLRVKKSTQTCLVKYGATCAMNTETNQEKIKQNNLKKYGVEYYLQSNDKKEKSKKTCMKKYNTEIPNLYGSKEFTALMQKKYNVD